MSHDPSDPVTMQTEAAGWVARLTRPGRESEDEAAFRRWVDSDPAHAAQFAKATEVWEALGGLGPYVTQQRRRTRVMIGVGLATAASLAAVLVAGAFEFGGTTTRYATAHGEQRQLRLADGSRLTLNTDTEVKVRFSRARRTLVLLRGEALFQVAKDSSRPFTVWSDGRRVQAFGTTFEVDRRSGDLKVLLLEGKVSVGRASILTGLGLDNRWDIALHPGQQWSVARNDVVRLDQDSLDRTLAWTRREILFSDTPISEAVAEINRYAQVPIRVEQDAGAKRISGIFAADATDSFVNTVAALHDLAVVRKPDAILLVQSND